MNKTNFILSIFFIISFQVFGQQAGLTFQNAEKQGILIEELDRSYQSALHSDTSLAVFKTDAEQIAMQKAYHGLLQDLGKFLSQNNFDWKGPTKCFNRIYFNSDGTIDYFLFNFLGTNSPKPSADVEEEFEKLLNIFISDYKFKLTANTKFSQCSPVTYMPKK